MDDWNAPGNAYIPHKARNHVVRGTLVADTVTVTYGNHEPDFWSINGSPWVDANAPPAFDAKTSNILK